MINIRNELCITCSWSLNPAWSHRVSGHIFEIIDYYYILKQKYDVCILLCDPINTSKWLREVITVKYNFSEDEIESIVNATIFCNSPKYIKCKNILFVDGCLSKMEQSGVKIFSDQIYTFKCSRYNTIHDLEMYTNVIPLLDYRVYNNINQEDVNIGTDYRKKILLDRYKHFENTKKSTALIYATKNCRLLESVELENIIHKYTFNDYLLITDTPDTYYKKYENVKICVPPVEKLFCNFDTYIYTPTLGKWDGSPRFPVECAFYNKNTIYHGIDDDYLKSDAGLFWRLHDIENNFKSLYLKNTDDIFDILAL